MRRNRSLIDIIEDHERDIKRLRQALARAGGVSDHGALTGLTDDDHGHYWNDARGATGAAAKIASDDLYLQTTGDTMTGALILENGTNQELTQMGRFDDVFGLAAGDSGTGIYMGKTGSGGSPTASIETTWKNTANPTIAIGVTRDGVRSSTVWNYNNIIDHLAVTHSFWNQAGSTKFLQIAATSTFYGALNFAADPSTSIRIRNAAETEGFAITKTVNPDNHLAIWSYQKGGNALLYDGTWRFYDSIHTTVGITANSGDMTGPGISYPGATIGGGSANKIGFRWNGGSIRGTIDNVVSHIISNVSDRRLKHNLVKVPSALEMIRSMPDTYSYQAKNFDGTVDEDSLLYGQMADEMEAIFPELVTGDGKDRMILDAEGVDEIRPTYQSIDYVTMIPLLVQAVKELAEAADSRSDKRRKP